MKIFNGKCDELLINGGILKDDYGIFYLSPGYVYHRIDGPACEWPDDRKSWYYENNFIMSTIGDVTPEQLQKFLLRII